MGWDHLFQLVLFDHHDVIMLVNLFCHSIHCVNLNWLESPIKANKYSNFQILWPNSHFVIVKTSLYEHHLVFLYSGLLPPASLLPILF